MGRKQAAIPSHLANCRPGSLPRQQKLQVREAPMERFSSDLMAKFGALVGRSYSHSHYQQQAGMDDQ